MKKIVIILLLICVSTIANAQKSVENLIESKQIAVNKIRLLNTSIDSLKNVVEIIDNEIGQLKLNSAKEGGLKLSVGAKSPFLMKGEYGNIGKIQENEILSVIGYDQSIERVKVYSPSLDKIGFVVIGAFEDQNTVNAYIKNYKPETNLNLDQEQSDVNSKFLVDLSRLTVNRSWETRDKYTDFDKNGAEAIDIVDGYLKIKNSSGQIGYVYQYSVDNYRDIASALNEKIVNENTTNQPLYIHNITVSDINSADGVDFSVDYAFNNSDEVIKYLEITVIPYNAVGDVQKGRISGESSFTGQITGPIKSEAKLLNGTWAEAWYNNTISCIKITKVKVIYMSGKSYVYVNELSKILSDNIVQCR
jgi:hypothetical protein